MLDALLAISPVGPLSPKSAIALGVGTLVGSFILRGVLRWVWHRATPMALGIVVGAPATVDTVARRVVTHPETRLHLVGYLSNSTEEDSAELVAPRHPRRHLRGRGGRRRSSASSSPNSRCQSPPPSA